MIGVRNCFDLDVNNYTSSYLCNWEQKSILALIPQLKSERVFHVGDGVGPVDTRSASLDRLQKFINVKHSVQRCNLNTKIVQVRKK